MCRLTILNTVINYSKLNSLELSRESKRRWRSSFFFFSEHLRIPFGVFFFFPPPDRKDRFAFGRYKQRQRVKAYRVGTLLLRSFANPMELAIANHPLQPPFVLTRANKNDKRACASFLSSFLSLSLFTRSLGMAVSTPRLPQKSFFG